MNHVTNRDHLLLLQDKDNVDGKTSAEEHTTNKNGLRFCLISL